MEVGRPQAPGAQRAQESYRAAREELARATRDRVRQSREGIEGARPRERAGQHAPRTDRLDISNASREVLARMRARAGGEGDFDVRHALERIRSAIAQGDLNNPDAVRKAASRLLGSLDDGSNA